jgi:hypothetical protein
MIRLLVLTLAFMVAIPVPVQAHERSRSHSNWTLDGSQLSGRFTVDARLSTLLLALTPHAASLESALSQALAERLTVTLGGRACRLTGIPRPYALPGGQIRAELDWVCDSAAGELIIAVEVFAPLAANHVHFIRLQKGDGPDDERVLSRNRTRAVFDTSPNVVPGPFSALGSYFVLGVEHILGGADHLVFLAALLLLIHRFRDPITITLGFTVGHSITLALTTLGHVAPPTPAIEAVIGFSIVFVAAEAVFTNHHRVGRYALLAAAGLLLAGLISMMNDGPLPVMVWLGLSLFVGCYGLWLSSPGTSGGFAPGISGLFGLVHGVGFGGVLVASQIAPSRLVPSLLGFNLGVEVGQLFALGIAGGVIWAIRRYAPTGGVNQLRVTAALVASSLGMFWFVSRALVQI